MVYFSNGTEGGLLDEQCQNCLLGQEACPIYLVQTIYNYDQCTNLKLKNAMNLLINEKGECQMFIQLKKKNVQPNPNQLNLL